MATKWIKDNGTILEENNGVLIDETGNFLIDESGNNLLDTVSSDGLVPTTEWVNA